jgi:hypothetical protein
VLRTFSIERVVERVNTFFKIKPIDLRELRAAIRSYKLSLGSIPKGIVVIREKEGQRL